MIVTNPVICFGTNKKGPDEVVAKVVCLKIRRNFQKSLLKFCHIPNWVKFVYLNIFLHKDL